MRTVKMTPRQFNEWVHGKVIDSVTFRYYGGGDCVVASITTTDGYCIGVGLPAVDHRDEQITIVEDR